MTKLHLDTDLGGDIDDLCALAMLLRWEGVQFTGITTVAEANGRRAGYVRHILRLEGRTEIPVAAGADVADGFYRYPELGYPDEERYWREAIRPSPIPWATRFNSSNKASNRKQRSSPSDHLQTFICWTFTFPAF